MGPAPSVGVISFSPYRLDPGNAEFWRAGEKIPLRPKVFAVLQYLAERPTQLVTKDELLDAVWPDTEVTDTVLKVCIRELRKVLADSATQPKFIETVHRRGYRFVAPVSRESFAGGHDGFLPAPLVRLPPLVGREVELAQLRRLWSLAIAGQRQVVFVTGEPGIGKTALLDAFLAEIPTAADPWIARGQCVEHYGTAEAYLPVLEGLGRLARQARGERLVTWLRAQAPSWLLQLPGLIDAGNRAVLQREYAADSAGRMLRELLVGLETLTADRPMILALEDLHWTDLSTLDLLSALARRKESARLLVIGTYRVPDASQADHPLWATMQALLPRHASELSLSRLSRDAVANYLVQRLPDAAVPATLADVVHEHTDGHPLFMVGVADAFATAAVAGTELARVVPASLQQLISAQIERLSGPERRLLEAASVHGIEFSLPAVAAALREPLETVAARCAALRERHQFVRWSGTREWPDGTQAGRCAFTHALYQEALYARLTPDERTILHQRVGEALEAVYGGRTSAVAAELAMHFERAGDAPRTIRYLQQAGANAVDRHAYREAIAQLSKALALLEAAPPSRDSVQRELDLRIALGVPLLNIKGFAAIEVEQTYARAMELCRQLGETPQLFPVIEGLHSFYAIRGDIPTAHHLAQQMLRLADSTQERGQLIEAHHAMGCIEFFRGELVPAREHLEQAVRLYEPQDAATAFQQSGHDPKVCCLCHLGLTLWFSGYADQALQRVEEALALAATLRHPYSIALAQMEAAWIHLLRGESRCAQDLADATLTVAREHGFAYWSAVAAMFRGTALAIHADASDGLRQVQLGFAGAEVIGVGKVQYLAMRADTCGRAGRRDDGLAAIAEALALIDRSGERYLEAELHRLRGELLLQGQSNAERGLPDSKLGDPQSAEACFHRAIAVARRQQARALELRAVRSLCRLWRDHGRRDHARDMLRNIFAWFTEGFDTTDLRSAAALLRELESAPTDARD